MIDFLRANPYVSKEEYLWHWTIPQIRLASYDFTHVEYLSEKQAEAEAKKRNSIKVDNVMDFMTDLGVPVFNKK